MCMCFRAGNKQVYPENNEAEYLQALLSAEELLTRNASKVVTDTYSLEADIGQGAFARVVQCVHKVTCYHLTATAAFLVVCFMTILLVQNNSSRGQPWSLRFVFQRPRELFYF